ncbi:hypothetical protein BZG36_05583, partial [Bifiguratus adelaidae]
MATKAIVLLASVTIAAAQAQYANTDTLANPNPTGSFAPQPSPVFANINTKIASSLHVTAVPTGAVPTGALPTTAPALSGYPTAWVTPPTNSAEVQAAYNAIDWSLVPKAAVHAGNSQTGPSLSGYPASDPYCDWSYSLCNVPKVSYLPPDIYYCPSPDTWGLSYDDGPLNPESANDPSAEPNLYNFLAAYNQKATLFYIGSNVLGFPQAAQRALADGHTICVHTWSHPPMTTKTNLEVVAELYWTLKVIKETLGVTPRCWRPPYGDVDDRVRAIAWQMGMRTIIWDWDSNDWNIEGPDGGSLTAATVDSYFNTWIADAKKYNHGHIVLEHELSSTTVSMAEKWLPSLQQAFKVVPATECFNISNPYWETNFRYPVLGPGTPSGSPSTTPTASNCPTYTVKSGDSPYSIEQAYHITAAQLQAFNPTVNFSVIYPGQVLCVGAPTTTTTSKTTTKATTTSTKATSTPTSGSCPTYTVKSVLCVGAPTTTTTSKTTTKATTTSTKTTTSSTKTSTSALPTSSPYITSYRCAHYSTATSTLNTCAKMESRYGVSASQIAAWNPTLNCSKNLTAGTRVCFSAISVTYKCAHYATATSSLNTCAKMMSKYSVSSTNFALWNPKVNCSKDLPVGELINDSTYYTAAKKVSFDVHKQLKIREQWLFPKSACARSAGCAHRIFVTFDSIETRKPVYLVKDIVDPLSRVYIDHPTMLVVQGQEQDDPSQVESSNKDMPPKSSDGEPPDGGYGWAVVVGVFWVTFVVIGWSSSWGVLQLAFLKAFSGSVTLFQLAWVGSLGAAFIYVAGPVAGPLISKFGVRSVLMIGTFSMVLGVQLTSLVQTLWPLFFTVSLLAGVGSSLLFVTSMSIPARWFTKKQGLALGIAASGGGLGGTVFVEILTKLIDTVGLTWAIRIEGFIFLALLIGSIALIKPYVGGHDDPGGSPWDPSLFKNIHYDFLLLSAFIYAFAYLVPFFYLPSYAEAGGLGTVNGAASVAVYSAANGIGRFALAAMGDHAGNFNMLIISNLLSGFMLLVAWNATQNVGALYTFAIIGGFFSGGYWSVITAVVGQVV